MVHKRNTSAQTPIGQQAKASSKWAAGYAAGKASLQGELEWHREEVARLTAAESDMLAALREQWRVLNAEPKPPDAEMVAAARKVEAALARAGAQS